MDNQETKKEKKLDDPIVADRMNELMELLKKSIDGGLDDVSQQSLIQMVQRNRAFVLEFALAAYMDNPKNAHLLEGVNQILTQIEKVVRDDRKEALKKKESESNTLSFNQMLEAMQKLSNQTTTFPTFNFESFILDPTKPVAPETSFFNPINQYELEQGNKLVDIDGEAI